MADGYKGGIGLGGQQVVKAPITKTVKNGGKVTKGGDLRSK